MWGSVIAVLGTLLGSVTAYMLQLRSVRSRGHVPTGCITVTPK